MLERPAPAPYGVHPDTTSVPRPAPFVLDRNATAHIVLTDGPHPDVTALLRAWDREGRGPLELLTRSAFPFPVRARAAAFVGTAACERALAEHLTAARVGVRLYLCGPDAMVRGAARIAAAAGLERDEVVERVTDAGRRVWCVHCKATTPGAVTSPWPCAGCGRSLEVYHHFSRRHAAHLGYMVDAEG
jgi:hypothetical protein